MYARVSKINLFNQLLDNNKVISDKLIKNIFDYILQEENVTFAYTFSVKSKIKCVLVSLKATWNRIERNGAKTRSKFLKAWKNQFVEIKVELSNVDDSMDIDPSPIDTLFSHLRLR